MRPLVPLDDRLFRSDSFLPFHLLPFPRPFLLQPQDRITNALFGKAYLIRAYQLFLKCFLADRWKPAMYLKETPPPAIYLSVTCSRETILAITSPNGSHPDWHGLTAGVIQSATRVAVIFFCFSPIFFKIMSSAGRLPKTKAIVVPFRENRFSMGGIAFFYEAIAFVFGNRLSF